MEYFDIHVIVCLRIAAAKVASFIGKLSTNLSSLEINKMIASNSIVRYSLHLIILFYIIFSYYIILWIWIYVGASPLDITFVPNATGAGTVYPSFLFYLFPYITIIIIR